MFAMVACALLMALMTGCATVRFSNLVGVHFGNRGPGSLHDVHVSSGNCVWAMRLITANPNPNSSAGITPYCNPGKVLTIQWTNDQGIRHRHELNIPHPNQLMVGGWDMEFKGDKLTVRQREEDGPEIYHLISKRQIYP
jgi:hypothetical protein